MQILATKIRELKGQNGQKGPKRRSAVALVNSDISVLLTPLTSAINRMVCGIMAGEFN